MVYTFFQLLTPLVLHFALHCNTNNSTTYTWQTVLHGGMDLFKCHSKETGAASKRTRRNI